MKLAKIHDHCRGPQHLKSPNKSSCNPPPQPKLRSSRRRVCASQDSQSRTECTSSGSQSPEECWSHRSNEGQQADLFSSRGHIDALKSSLLASALTYTGGGGGDGGDFKIFGGDGGGGGHGSNPIGELAAGTDNDEYALYGIFRSALKTLT